MKILIKSIIIFLITMGLGSCVDFCTEEYKHIVPVSVFPVKSQFKKGDTIHFQVLLDRTMVYDSFQRKTLNIPTFNPFLQVHNIIIDSFPTKDDLDTNDIICNSGYNYVFFSSIISNGMRIDTPMIVNDSIIIKGSIILTKSGTHMMYFDSPIGLLKHGRTNGFPFQGKCLDSFTDAYLPLLNDNNDIILTQNNRDVIKKHFEKFEGGRQRSAKFFYNVIE